MAPQARVRGPARPRSARHEQGAPGRTPRRRPERRRHAYRRRRLHGGRSRLPAGRRPSRLHAAARPGHGAAPHRRRLPGRADGRGRGGLGARRLAARRDRPRPAGGPPLRDCRAAAREGTPRGAVVSGLVLRAAESRDVEPAGDVNFVAFYRAALAHGLVPAVTTPADSRRYIRHLLEFDPLGGVVAEEDDRIVGVGWVHPRGAVATLGPLAVDPGAQGRGIGRRLLERAVELAGKGLPQVRLVQESFNAVSLGLYLRAGFRIVAPILELALGAGTALAPPRAPAGAAVRPAAPADAPRLVARDARAFGAPRPQSIDLYLRRGRVLVAEDRGALAGYAMGIGFEGVAHLGSAAADDAEVLLCLAGTVASELAAPGHRVRTMGAGAAGCSRRAGRRSPPARRARARWRARSRRWEARARSSPGSGARDRRPRGRRAGRRSSPGRRRDGRPRSASRAPAHPHRLDRHAEGGRDALRDHEARVGAGHAQAGEQARREERAPLELAPGDAVATEQDREPVHHRGRRTARHRREHGATSRAAQGRAIIRIRKGADGLARVA